MNGVSRRRKMRLMTCSRLPKASRAGVAWWGRAAQVRLARLQPPAYSHFDVSEFERRHLAHDQPTELPATWLIEAPRNIYVLISQQTFETPVDGKRDFPLPGDVVYL